MSDLYIANTQGQGFSQGDHISVTNFYNTTTMNVHNIVYMNQTTGNIIPKPDHCCLDSLCGLLYKIIGMLAAQPEEVINVNVTASGGTSSATGGYADNNNNNISTITNSSSSKSKTTSKNKVNMDTKLKVSSLDGSVGNNTNDNSTIATARGDGNGNNGNNGNKGNKGNN
jgi:hypothetical protein